MRVASRVADEVTVKARDPFLPPLEVEERCTSTLRILAEGLPPVPACQYPSSVGGPVSYDRNTAIVVMNSVTQWSEHLIGQIGLRRARMQALQAGVTWMEAYVKFTYKGKLDGLSQEQYERLARDKFERDCLEAEITLLESRQAALTKAFTNASRNLTGVIAPN